MRILIEGIGGVGGIVAGELIRAGHKPTLVSGNAEIADNIGRRGLRVITPEKSFEVHPEVFVSLDDIEDGTKFDAALLIMKANRVLKAAQDSLPFLYPEGFVVTFQNGIVEDSVAEVTGKQKVVSAIIGFGATMHQPGEYERTSGGKIHLGEMDGPPLDRTRRLGKILSAVTAIDLNSNMRGALWSKLAINCIVTSIGGLTGMSLGQMLSERRLRDIFAGVYREVIDTAEAAGIKLEKIAADPKLLYVPTNASFITRWYKDFLLRMVGKKYAGLKSSIIQSLERGRPTEVDFLNGQVVRTAKKAGMSVPLNERIVEMIGEIEKGSRLMGLGNLKELESLM